MYHFANLAAAEAALKQFLPSSLPRVAYTTEHVRSFLEYVGNPQDTIPAIHIAGTSGKTSTACYAAALLQDPGKRIGLLTSPHIHAVTERVQINLQPLADRLFCDELAKFMDLIKKSGIQLTYAEVLYSFAYWEFARQSVDYMVVETGLGGLLDATNVITRPHKTCIITDISLDHTNVLGNTIEEIAEQKAGIITHNSTVFTYDQPRALPIIDAACRHNQADLHVVTPAKIPQAAALPLFQQRNFGLASAATNYVRKRDKLGTADNERIQAASHIAIPARMEILPYGHRTIILDGAHNAQKLQALRESIAAQFPDQPIAVLVGFIRGGGRDLLTLLAELEPLYAHVIATAPSVADGHEWYTPAEITAAAHTAGITSCETIDDYGQAVKALIKRPEPVLVITGSLYIHQHARPLLNDLLA